MAKPFVSIITPTHERDPFLKALAACVRAQAYADVEWLVLDDSASPSRVLSNQNSSRLRYMHTTERLSVGEKRNRLVELASGDIVAHFDDDDYYGPDYLSQIVRVLESEQLDFMRLTAFFVAQLNLGEMGYYRTLVKRGPAFEFNRHGIQAIALERLEIPLIHLAYGWTYVYRKAVWLQHPFPSMNVFEDREFVRAAQKSFRIKAAEDRRGLCVHSVHSRSSSRCFPQFRIPPFMLRSLFPGTAEHMAWLQRIAQGHQNGGPGGREHVKPAHNQTPECDANSILTCRAEPRKRPSPFTIVRPDDFVPKGPAIQFKDVDRDAVIVPYCLDRRQGQRIYVACNSAAELGQHAFLYQFLRSEERQIIKTPWAAPALFADRSIDDPVFVFSPGRCGSTLFHRIVRASGGFSLSEPDFYTQAVRILTAQKGLLQATENLPETVAKMTHDLVAPTQVDGTRRTFIKLRSDCCAEPRLVLSGLRPGAKTMFIIRPVRPWVRSVHRAFGFKPEMIARRMRQAINCLTYLKQRTNCTVIRYEELIQPSEQFVTRLNDQFELACSLTSIAEVGANDAQANTLVSRSALSKRALDEHAVEETMRLWTETAPFETLRDMELLDYLEG